mmetsp:Transcript_19499/g.40075  ORF Transcript_19499/g.40075 Transcript_19499/m.40075 type:complete len:235 (-) Transcript_19499:1828-2532(-)
MPTSLAMAHAVGLESPVIIITRTPASLQRRIDSDTSARAGSLMPVSPKKVRSDSIASNFAGSVRAFGAAVESPSPPSCPPHRPSSAPSSFPPFMANPIVRKGRFAMASILALTAVLSAGVSGNTAPLGSITFEHRFSSMSGAPLTQSLLGQLALSLVAGRTSTDIDLRLRLNSRVANRFHLPSTAEDTFLHKAFASSSDPGSSAAPTASSIAASELPSFSARTLSAASVGSPVR